MIEARDTGSPETARKGRGRDFWPEDKPGRRLPGPKVLFGAAAALVAVVVAVVAVLVFTGGDEAPAGEPVVPTAYTPDFNGEGFQQIADRSADGREITEGEAASAKELESGGHKFTLAKSDLTGDCKAATWGERLHGDLDKFGCTQLVRSAYVSSDKKYAGQFYVFNLKNEEGVKQILRDLAPETGAGWVKPLNAPGVPAFGSGFSAAYAKTYGHYAVITAVERAGGERPDSLNELIDVSLVVEGAADFLYGRLDLAANAGAGQ
ncbi:hypothetical protein FHX41_3665 [Actinomadura hallensis]|uniref:Uncharacterized protein n=1 Tax=Actinomadura hallensis TaxID=337895 RepID=A0A543IHC3_9ACTN|nr:hypothetical protein [Actinomadura hallensis]TQM69947.1 hypothetical protein FHX41_3665 [Actinomadura hallensis]HLV75673.1 hypothetical protein [Vulgatibacteraceae bacterium]